MHSPRNLLILAALFIVAGTMHFVAPVSYAAIMPSWIPYQIELVYATGVLEMAGGAGLLVRPVRRWAAIGLILLLIAVFPANVQMLVDGLSSDVSPARKALLWLRLPLQPLLIVWIFRSALSRPS